MKEININLIDGFKIGHAQDLTGGSGCTAIVCPCGAYAGAEVRGGAPATREIALLDPVNMVEQIHCVMLSGGSAFGLAAAEGAMTYLEEQDIGFDTGAGRVPIVSSACLFDLVAGDSKCRPTAAMGYEAMKNAEKNQPSQGCVGAGTGATVGKLKGPGYAMKSGLGIYAVSVGALQMGAIVAVNALGDVFDLESGKALAGLLNEDKTAVVSTRQALYAMAAESFNVFAGNTTIGCIITNAKLTKTQCAKVAAMTHNGYARVICPVHTSADGDTVFVLSHGDVLAHIDVVGTLCAEVMAKAINNAVLASHSCYGFKANCDL
ncbi:MAG: P1 family peptidase [Bacillota bacterium]|nr:P1 family peptidase [Bacillota bacterium]